MLGRRRNGVSRLRIVLLALVLCVPGIALVPGVASAATGTISSTGPLTTITTSPDLNCTVNYAGDTQPEFYAGTACGTFVAVDGTLFGPAEVPAGSNAGPRTAFTPVSQTGPTGAGTRADPFRLVTVVDAGSTGFRITQYDTYVTGEQSYSTTVEIANSRDAAVRAIVYRAADCYLADSDSGTGQGGTDGSVACVSANGRAEGWIPLSGGSHYFEAGYGEVWARIGSQQDFPSTCRCGENIDNGAGLSWNVVVPASNRAQVAHRTAFSSAAGADDRDGDGLLDDWESRGLDVDGNGTVDVDLPAMGASPDHKDLFVEVDHMVRPNQHCIWFYCWGSLSFAPNGDAMADVVRAFGSAPVTNPDGTTGVRMHLDAGPNSVMNPVTGQKWGNRSRSNEVAYTRSLGTIIGDDLDTYSWSDFTALKSANFEPGRADAFHYAMDVDTYAGSGSSGIAQGLPGDSFLVAKGATAFGYSVSRREEAGTFMHELGHSLGLHHGGGLPDEGLDLGRKPNYPSIMNYDWQLGGRPIDYSRTEIAPLDERALDERGGVPGSGPVRWHCGTGVHNGSAGTPLDFNCSGGIDGGTVSTSINRDSRLDVLRGHEDWSKLTYDGGAVGSFGAGDLDDQNPPPATTPVQEEDLESILAGGPLGDPGDGAVRAVGPTVLFADTAGQSIQVDVRNAGPRPADYDVRIAGLPAAATGRAIGVPPGGTGRVVVPVDTTGLRPGTLDLGVTLTAPGGTDPLDTDTLPVTVPDMSDPAVRDAARDAQNRLRTPQPGLDEGVRTAAVATLDAVSGTGPAAPTAVTATPGDGSATVSWTPPADSSRVTGYVVTASPGGATTEVTGAGTRTATVRGLANGTAYTFTVTPRAGTVNGTPSAPSAPVTPVAAPARVDHVTATISGINRPLALRADGDAPATAFTSTTDARGAVLSLRGTARVAGDGTTYDVRVNLTRRNALSPLTGTVTVTDTRTGVASTAVAPWPGRVDATAGPGGGRVMSATLTGLRGSGRTLQSVRIGLTVTDR